MNPYQPHSFGTGMINMRRMPMPVAEIAVRIAESIGPVPDITAEQTAAYACETADRLWKEFEARGWLLEVPEPERKP